MASVNKVILVGNLGRDPEVRYLPSGDAVANFSIAMTESWKAKDGSKQEKTEWMNVEVFGKLAEIVRDYCVKGKQVYIEGSLNTQDWKTKDGDARKTTRVKLSGPNAKLVLLGSGDNKKRDEPQDSAEASRPSGPPPDDFQVSEDDCPFGG